MCRCVNVCKCVCTHHGPHVEVRGLLTFPSCMNIAAVYIRPSAGFWEFSCLYCPSPWSCSGITDMYYHVLGLQTCVTMFWEYRHELPCPREVLGIQTRITMSWVTDMNYHVLGLQTCTTMSWRCSGIIDMFWDCHIFWD